MRVNCCSLGGAQLLACMQTEKMGDLAGDISTLVVIAPDMGVFHIDILFHSRFRKILTSSISHTWCEASSVV